MGKLVTLLRGLTRTLGRESQLTPFLRGISMGALVGAAIAGSTIWRRRGSGQGARPERDPESTDPRGGRV